VYRVLVPANSDVVITDNAASVVIPWTTPTYDVGSWFSLGSPNVLTVPVGITVAQFAYEITVTHTAATPSAGADVTANIQKNGANLIPLMTLRQAAVIQALQTSAIIFVTPPLEVVAGNQFSVLMTVENFGQNPTRTAARTWFAAWSFVTGVAPPGGAGLTHQEVMSRVSLRF
jgi:hypothetical protein